MYSLRHGAAGLGLVGYLADRVGLEDVGGGDEVVGVPLRERVNVSGGFLGKLCDCAHHVLRLRW